LIDRPDLSPIASPMLTAWRQLRTQIALFDKAVRALVRENRVCRLLMSVPGIGVLTALGYVSTIEDPVRFNLAMRQRFGSGAAVRGRRGHSDSREAPLTPEELGTHDRPAIGSR